MAINWSYDAKDVQEFPLIPIGDHRVRIEKAEEKISRSGNDMIKLQLAVSGQAGMLFYYLVFMPDNSTQTNTNLKRIWNSFGIEENNLDCKSWIGKVGAVRVKHELYDGEQRAQIAYLLDKNKQEGLPPWVEKSSSATVQSTGFTEVNTDVPFSAGDLPL